MTAPKPRTKWTPGASDRHWLDKIEHMPFVDWMKGWQVARVKRTPWRRDHFGASMGIKRDHQGHHWWLSDPDPDRSRSTFRWSWGFLTQDDAMRSLWQYIYEHQRPPGILVTHHQDESREPKN